MQMRLSVLSQFRTRGLSTWTVTSMTASLPVTQAWRTVRCRAVATRTALGWTGAVQHRPVNSAGCTVTGPAQKREDHWREWTITSWGDRHKRTGSPTTTRTSGEVSLVRRLSWRTASRFVCRTPAVCGSTGCKRTPWDSAAGFMDTGAAPRHEDQLRIWCTMSSTEAATASVVCSL